MNSRLFTLLVLCLSIASVKGFSQSIVQVSPLTGAVNVRVPIYTISNGQVSVPVSISYNNTGIKPKDVEGAAGMGWQLTAGGQIAREVRGLPDDCLADNKGNSMLGWMSSSNSNAYYGPAYSIQNDGTCGNGATDVANINQHMPVNNDSEPDIYYVNAPGLSCELVYDVSSGFHPLKYQDLLISYSVTGGSGTDANTITSFTITNDKGIKYQFATAEMVTQTTVQKTGTAQYFTTKYQQYKNGITYSDQWKLTSITDPNGNSIIFNYENSGVRNSIDPIGLYLAGSSALTSQYTIQQAVTPEVLVEIYENNVNNPSSQLSPIFFTWNAPNQIVATGQTVISSITGMGRSMQFAYSLAQSASGHYKRAFLTNFIDYGCGSPTNYQFGYNGLNVTSGTVTLGDSTSNDLDYWGYYTSDAHNGSLIPSVYVNPSTSGYPRYAVAASTTVGAAYTYTLSSGNSWSVSPSDITDGALNVVTYTQGGTSTITYEPNDYYDPPSGTVVQGGGVRVKQVVDYDGVSTTNNIIRNYSYINPTGVANAGLSSGSPVTLPQFAFTIPYSGTANSQTQGYWNSATALSNTDLSDDDESILYAYNIVSQAGAGSTQYQFNNSGMYWNASSGPVCSGCTPGEWKPTIDYAASYSCTNSNGPIANLMYSYPFLPNPNYNFERGIPIQITNFNDAGGEVAESDYTYVRSYGTPGVISPLKSDDGPTGTAKFYGQYTIFYNTSELTASVTNKTFDAAGAGQYRSSITNYAYTSPNHKLLTAQTVINSDNTSTTPSVTTSNYSYVDDYNAAAGSNVYVNALYYMQKQHMNLPIESYQQVTRGSTTLTTNATINQYKGFTFTGFPTLYLPARELKWIQPAGAAFTPYAVSGSSQTATYDSKYFVTGNLDSYDNTGVVRTADNNYESIQTTLTDYNTGNPVASFKNAAAAEVAFADFDSNLAPGNGTFTISGSGSYTPSGSHSGVSAGLYATTQTVTSTSLTKNVIAQNYIFSIWINAIAKGSLTLIVSGVSSYPVVNYSAGGWNYYEIKIPTSTISSNFTVSFTSSQSVSIDDILLYPDVAEAATASWDPTTHFKTSQTNTNGISSYYQNDQWGRVTYTLDQDKNIVERKTYADATSNATFLTPTIHGPSTMTNGIAANFSNTSPDACTLDGVTYTWDFGDKTPDVITTSTNSVSHVYTTNTTFPVTLTASSTLYGNKTATMSVGVSSLQSVKISYQNYCTTSGKFASAIHSIVFLQGSATMYTFYAADLLSGVDKIVPGTYTIQINTYGTQYDSINNPNGYTSVSYHGATSQCWNYSGSTYTITDNLSYTPSISFGIQQVVCSQPPGGGVQ